MSDWEEAKRAAQSLFHDELRSGEPEEKYQALIQEARFELGERHPFLAYPLTGLGNLYFAERRYDEAAAVYKEAISIWDEQPTENYHITSPLSNLGITYTMIGNEEAVGLFSRVIDIQEKAGRDIERVHPLDRIAFLYAHWGMRTEAEEVYKEADALVEKHGIPYDRSKHPVFDRTLIKFEEQTLEGAQQLYQKTLREERHLPPRLRSQTENNDPLAPLFRRDPRPPSTDMLFSPARQPSVPEPERDIDLEPDI